MYGTVRLFSPLNVMLSFYLDSNSIYPLNIDYIINSFTINQPRRLSTMVRMNKKCLKKFYEKEASRIDHQELMYVKENRHRTWWHRKRLKYIISFLMKILKEAQVVTFVDIGCAEGYYVKRAVSLHNEMFCVGVDIARMYIKKAKKHVKKSNVDFAVCDIENLPFKECCFDIVLCSEVLEHVRDYRKAFIELNRIAKKYLVLSFPGHSYIYEVISKIGFFKKLINNIMPNVGHISEISIDSIKCLVEAYGDKASMEIRIGGALPLQLYEIIPSVKLVSMIDDMMCKILRHLSALEYTTIHVIKIERNQKDSFE